MTKIKIEITLEVDDTEWMQRHHVDAPGVRSSVYYTIHELVSQFMKDGDFGVVTRSSHSQPRNRPLGRRGN